MQIIKHNNTNQKNRPTNIIICKKLIQICARANISFIHIVMENFYYNNPALTLEFPHGII